MFCKECGTSVEEGVGFCTQCGANLKQATPQAPTTSAQVQPASHQQPVYQQPAYQQPAYQQQSAYPQVPPKKKRHTGLFITLGILIVLVGAAVYLLGNLSFFKPKNLGIKYTPADYNSVINKLGLHVTADLGNGETYDNAPILTGDTNAKANSTITDKTLKDKLSYTDFEWSFSDYKPVSVTLTPEEASAFFNEIAPSFWWFDDTQVDIASDGTIITSSKANIEMILEDLYPDVAGSIPIPLPGSANIYTEGDFSITNNKIDMTPTVFKVGPVGIPEKYLVDDNLAIVSEHLEQFYTIIPELQINKAGVEGGNFVFDGVIPTEVNVNPKN